MGDTKYLNITFLSAQGLKDVCTFGTMSPYAKAWIDSSTKQRTPVATNAGCTPVWGHKISLPLPPDALKDEKLALTIQIWSQGSASDTIVGSANLPLGDIITSTTPNGLEFMACQLLRPSGRVQGVVNFSVEISSGVQASGSRHSSASSQENVKVDKPMKDGVSDFSKCASTSNNSTDKKPLQAPDALGSGKGSNLASSTLKDKVSTNLRLDKSTFEAAPDALGDGHRIRHVLAAPDPLDRLPGDGKGAVQLCHNGDQESHPHSPQPQLAHPAGFGATMFGGVIGAILMGEPVNVVDGSGNKGNGFAGHSSSGVQGDQGMSEPGPGGSSTGVPAP